MYTYIFLNYFFNMLAMCIYICVYVCMYVFSLLEFNNIITEQRAHRIFRLKFGNMLYIIILL